MGKIDKRCELPAPETCRYCQSRVDLVNNSEVYGKSYGRWPHVYLCSNKVCRAFVGVHPNTQVPLGTLADAETRKARKEAHSAFDLIWKGGYMKRGEAYAWLAEKLRIETWRCHVAWFDAPMCRQVVKACQELLRERNGSLPDHEAYRLLA